MQIYMYQSHTIKTQLELKQNVVENKWIENENLWIQPHPLD